MYTRIRMLLIVIFSIMADGEMKIQSGTMKPACSAAVCTRRSRVQVCVPAVCSLVQTH